MRLTTRLGTILGAAVLAAGGVTIAGAGTAQAVTCGYPPGQCNINFRNAHFYPGQAVSFYTDQAFHPHEWVHGHVTCNGASWETKHFQANARRRVNNAFYIRRDVKPGPCQFTLTGNQGEVISGSFTVQARPHRHAGTAHHFAGTASGSA